MRALASLSNDPETDFDRIESLRQLAVFQADAVAAKSASRALLPQVFGPDGTPLDTVEATRATFDRIMGLATTRPDLLRSFAFVFVQAWGQEATFAETAERDPQGALRALDRVLGLPASGFIFPSQLPSVIATRARLLTKLGHPNAAAAELDRLIRDHPSSFANSASRLDAELELVLLPDPNVINDETLVKLERLWNDPRFAQEPGIVRVGATWMRNVGATAYAAHRDSSARLAAALDVIARVDAIRARLGLPPGPAPDGPPTDTSMVQHQLADAEREALGFLQGGVEFKRPELAAFACERWDVYLVDQPEHRSNVAAQAAHYRVMAAKRDPSLR
ncbi:MAG: hypothetical protein SFZ23_05570 [Planctomycetota bacterium]|nr:hypothetical protein [Planctomycetota bacterium]